MSALGNGDAPAVGRDVDADGPAIRRALERTWWPVALSSEIDAPFQTTLLDVPLVVYRGSDGAARVSSSVCPHRWASLGDGTVVGDAIECPYHGWRWDGGTGECVHVPSLADASRIPRNARLKTYAAVEKWGLVWTCLSDFPASPLPRPSWTWLEDGEWFTGTGRSDVDANLLFVQENFRDVAHFHFVHPTTIPTVSPLVESLRPVRDGYELHLERVLEVTETGEHWYVPGQIIINYDVVVPGVVCWSEGTHDRRSRYLLHVPSPLSLSESRIFYVTGVRAEQEHLLEEYVERDLEIFREDRAVVGAIVPRELGAGGLDDQVHTLSDVLTLMFRRAFFDWIEEAGDENAVAVTAADSDPRIQELG
jgi:nitrite reductase/ring-hydroxylating ferredoxin subunit